LLVITFGFAILRFVASPATAKASSGGQGVERAVEAFAAVCLLGVGLSHLVQPQAWVEFFVWLRGQGRCAVFVEALLNLNFGALVVAFHNVWTGPPVVLTVLGWGLVVKGLVRLIAPELGLRAYRRIEPERAWQFRVAGIIALALSAFFGYLVFSV
jgi:hypothetical protein